MYPFLVLISNIIQLYSIVLLVWAVLGLLISLRIVNAYQPFVRKLEDVLSRLVEPVLRPIRKRLPTINGIDLSPIVLLLLLNFLDTAMWHYYYRLN